MKAIKDEAEPCCPRGSVCVERCVLRLASFSLSSFLPRLFIYVFTFMLVRHEDDKSRLTVCYPCRSILCVVPESARGACESGTHPDAGALVHYPAQLCRVNHGSLWPAFILPNHLLISVASLYGAGFSFPPRQIRIRFMVHNGKTYVPVNVTQDMVGHKLGEFAPTKKRFVYKCVLFDLVEWR